MFIGHNLLREREAQKWSQESVANQAQMSQTNYSNIETNRQEARQEQIETFAKIFGVEITKLIEPKTEDTTAVKIGTQNGTHQNNGNNYITHSEGEVIALKSHIKSLEDQILTMRAFESEFIQELKERIRQLETDIKFWKEKVTKV
jgi:transcriptional regulator with XRE-family HTH domain